MANELGFDIIVRFCDKVPKKYKHREGEVPMVFHTFNRDSGAGSEIPVNRVRAVYKTEVEASLSS